MFKLSWSHHILSSSPWVALKLGYKYVQTKTSFLLSILRTACCQDPEYASENEATWETVSRVPNVVEPPASQRHILSEVWFWIDQNPGENQWFWKSTMFTMFMYLQSFCDMQVVWYIKVLHDRIYSYMLLLYFFLWCFESQEAPW